MGPANWRANLWPKGLGEVNQIIAIGQKLIYALLIFVPWKIRRLGLNKLLGYQISPSAKIGFSWVMPNELLMAGDTKIGALTVCKGISKLEMRESSSIGRLNWITGQPLDDKRHFHHEIGRNPSLVLGRHAAITNRHILDCTSRITIGAFSTLAGFRSQILTHSIDVNKSRQRSSEVAIGEYCFLGTGCILLAGSSLPSFCVLGAGSVMTKAFTEQYTLYAGVPAVPVKALAQTAKYFNREEGYVV